MNMIFFSFDCSAERPDRRVFAIEQDYAKMDRTHKRGERERLPPSTQHVHGDTTQRPVAAKQQHRAGQTRRRHPRARSEEKTLCVPLRLLISKNKIIIIRSIIMIRTLVLTTRQQHTMNPKVTPKVARNIPSPERIWLQVISLPAA